MKETTAFGARLRALRRSAGVAQRDLAQRVGVHFTYLSKIESGAMPPPASATIARLAAALGADADELCAVARKPGPRAAERARRREASRAGAPPVALAELLARVTGENLHGEVDAPVGRVGREAW
jgi:transcriptional regulator with XRE-family HTH domain